MSGSLPGIGFSLDGEEAFSPLPSRNPNSSKQRGQDIPGMLDMRAPHFEQVSGFFIGSERNGFPARLCSTIRLYIEYRRITEKSRKKFICALRLAACRT